MLHNHSTAPVLLSAFLGSCITLSGLPSRAAAGSNLKADFYHAFKGSARPKGWDVMGPDGDQCVKFEAEGLRITLPTGHAGAREDTGLVRGWAVQGDFEITVAYEILQEPRPNTGGRDGTRFTLAVALEKPMRNMATLSHRLAMKDGPKLVTWVSLWNEPEARDDAIANLFPVSAKAGRLRLVRTGTDISYYTADSADGDFTLLLKYPFGKEPLKYLSIAGSTGSDRSALDVRVTDLRIRAESLPGMDAPQPAPDKADKATEPPLEKKKLVVPVVKPAEDGLPPGWILGASLVAVLGLGGWFYVRKRRRQRGAEAQPETITLPRPITPQGPATISVPCPGCKARLKVKASAAGKKAKCPTCGGAVLIPASAAEASAEGQD